MFGGFKGKGESGEGMMDEDEVKKKAEVLLRDHLLRCFNDVERFSRFSRYVHGRSS